jgi:hypothetical protein
MIDVPFLVDLFKKIYDLLAGLGVNDAEVKTVFDWLINFFGG